MLNFRILSLNFHCVPFVSLISKMLTRELTMKVTLGLGLAALCLHFATPAIAKESRTPVLVELFTSEGCDSCPPANSLLTQLTTKQPVAGAYVVALGEHVDYFNTPWVDPFSSSQFTDRQSAFGRVFKLSEIYTPQMVVDGRAEVLGSDVDAARRAIARAADARHASVTLSTTPTADAGRISVRVHVSGVRQTGASKGYLFVAIAEDGLVSNVKSGENAGKTLTHSGVVRTLVKVRSVTGDAGDYSQTVTLSPKWNRDNLHAVAFVQDIDTGAIIGTGITNL